MNHVYAIRHRLNSSVDIILYCFWNVFARQVSRNASPASRATRIISTLPMKHAHKLNHHRLRHSRPFIIIFQNKILEVLPFTCVSLAPFRQVGGEPYFSPLYFTNTTPPPLYFTCHSKQSISQDGANITFTPRCPESIMCAHRMRRDLIFVSDQGNRSTKRNSTRCIPSSPQTTDLFAF